MTANRILKPGTSPTDPPVAPLKWFKRHIVIDHMAKKIMVQIMWDNDGNLNYNEYLNVKSGDWKQYLPQGLGTVDIDVRQKIGECFDSGYKPTPFYFQGIENDEHAIILLSDIGEPKLTGINL